MQEATIKGQRLGSHTADRTVLSAADMEDAVAAAGAPCAAWPGDWFARQLLMQRTGLPA